MLRRLILVAIACGIPLLWVFAPYGQRMGDSAHLTFAATLSKTADEAAASFVFRAEDVVLLTVFPGLLAPLYPAVAAAWLLVAPGWFATRRRWVWIAEGVGVLLLSAIGGFWATFSLVVITWGAAAPPVLYLPIWLLPGFAALAGIAAIAIGIAPRGPVARLVLG